MEDMRRHMVAVRGQLYMPVAARVKWFREEHPDWSILTKIEWHEPAQGVCVVRAYIYDDAGRMRATAVKMERASDFPDYLEKAETGAVGRALALCGYSTLGALDLNEDSTDVCDAPIVPRCEQCDAVLEPHTAERALSRLGRLICPDCYRARARSHETRANGSNAQPRRGRNSLAIDE